MGLDRHRRPAARRRRLDHVGVQRPLHQETDVPLHVPRRVLEHVDERMPDAAALLLGVLDSLELLEESLRRVDDAQIDAHVLLERALDLVALVQAEQPVIHEDAGQPVADGAVHECRGHGRVHAAREPADRATRLAHRFLDLRDFLLDVVPRRPIGRAMTDPEQEVRDDLAAAAGVGHFGMEQHAVDRLRLVAEPGDGRVVAGGDDVEVGWRRHDLVAVTRPDRERRPRGEASEQTRFLDRDLSSAVLVRVGRRDFAPREMRDQLHAVADPQDRNAEVEHATIDSRGARLEHRVGTARENDPLRGELLHEREVRAFGGRMDLAVHVLLAHAPRDQLRELRAAIEDQDLVHV